MTKQPTSDALPECREAFEKLAIEMGYSIVRRENGIYDSSHTSLMWTTWNASRSAFAEELVKRIRELRYTWQDKEWASKTDVIAIIRQMAGEK